MAPWTAQLGTIATKNWRNIARTGAFTHAMVRLLSRATVTGFEQCLKLDATDRSDFLSQLLLGLLNREEYSIQLILVSKIPLRWVEYATPIGDPTLSDKILVYEVPGSAVEVGDVKRVVPGLDDDVVQGIKTFVTSYYGGE